MDPLYPWRVLQPMPHRLPRDDYTLLRPLWFPSLLLLFSAPSTVISIMDLVFTVLMHSFYTE